MVALLDLLPPINFLRLAIYWKLNVNNLPFSLDLAGYTFLCALEDKHTHANIASLSVTAIGRKREERRWIHQ